MATSTIYPNGQVLISSAFTPAAISALIQTLTYGMIGLPTPPPSSFQPVQVDWQTTGQPFIQNPQQDVNGNSPPRVATAGVFSSILNSNLNQLQLTVLGIPLGAAGAVILAPVLALIGSILDSVLTPLLQAIGIQLGYADIKLLSLDCDAVELVF